MTAPLKPHSSAQPWRLLVHVFEAHAEGSELALMVVFFALARVLLALRLLLTIRVRSGFLLLLKVSVERQRIASELQMHRLKRPLRTRSPSKHISLACRTNGLSDGDRQRVSCLVFVSRVSHSLVSQSCLALSP